MADIMCYVDHERSEEIYNLLIHCGLLCHIPDCSQHKIYQHDCPFCYAHNKVNKKLMTLDPPVYDGGYAYRED